MKTRTILMLLVFAAQSLMTACSGQKGQYDKCLALDNDGYPLDLGYSMNISEDSINGFRLEFTRIDTTMSDTTRMITWVKLEKVEKTTDEHRTPADGDRFNTYLVEKSIRLQGNGYMERGTSMRSPYFSDAVGKLCVGERLTYRGTRHDEECYLHSLLQVVQESTLWR
jgi:lipoprotein